MDELIRLHSELHRRDTFAQVIYQYPFGRDIMANSIKELMSRTDHYEFFLARMQESKEIVGWIAISFDDEETEAENRVTCEARLEWTEMCSHILKLWKVDDGGEKSNAWDTIKRASSELQTKHLPRAYFIINAIVIIPSYYYAEVSHALLKHVIEFWRKRVMRGTEWAVWVQAPHYLRNLYIQHAFEEVGEYEVDLGDHGFFNKERRMIFGKFGWKFMVRLDPSGSASREPDGAAIEESAEAETKEPDGAAIEEPDGAQKVDKGKGKGKSKGKSKGKGKERRSDDPQENEDTPEQEAERWRLWEEAEQRLEDIRSRRGAPPMPGEVASLIKTQDRAEDQGLDTTDLGKGKGRAQPLQVERPTPPEEPPARPPQGDAEVAVQQQDNYTLSKREEKLIQAMRDRGIDEEEIEIVKALAFSLTDEAQGG